VRSSPLAAVDSNTRIDKGVVGHRAGTKEVGVGATPEYWTPPIISAFPWPKRSTSSTAFTQRI